MMNLMTVEKMSMKKQRKSTMENKMAPNWPSMKSMKSNPWSLCSCCFFVLAVLAPLALGGP